MSASFFVMLLVVVGINLLSNAQKKKQREQKRQSAAAAAQSEAAPVQTRRTSRRMMDDIFPELTSVERRPQSDDRFPDLTPRAPKAAEGARKAPAQTFASDFSEGAALGGSLEGTAAERTTLYSNIEAGVGKTQMHIVKPVTESSHRHMESSLDGVQGECAPEAELAPAAPLAPDASQAYVIPAVRKVSARQFAFDRTSVTMGFLYGEILGKPKAMRR